MKINKELITDMHSFAGHVMLTALLTALTKTILNNSFFKDWQDKKQIEVSLMVEGREFSILDVCTEWEKQVDRMITEKALELLKEKCNNLENVVNQITQEVEQKARKSLGIKTEE